MKYFGTDGIRGIYGEGITEDVAYRAGRALASLFSGKGVVGRDTRTSGPSLEDALISGITDGGADVITVGVLSTPGVSFMTRSAKANFGVAISASHNPPEYNGLKVFSSDGSKITVGAEEALEYYMDNIGASCGAKGKRYTGSSGIYLASLTEDAVNFAEKSGRSGRLDGLRILVDSGGGAAHGIAEEVFRVLGANVTTLCLSCKGECINVRCGALHPDGMAETARRGGFDLGVAFDGDADRLVVWQNRLLDGDEVMLNLASVVRAKTVVGTVMTNSALERVLAEKGARLVRASVGDRSVYEIMQLCKSNLGGEPSGHYIIGNARTGDGVLSALVVSSLFLSEGLQTLHLDPRKMIGVSVSPSVLATTRANEAVRQAKRIANRVVVRPSGTEPIIRIMAEGGDVDGAVELVRNALVNA